MFLAIIPARSGSKRIKNKNLKKINNKPLIYWTLKFASQIKELKKIVLTSDSAKILNSCEEFKNIDIIKKLITRYLLVKLNR